VRYATRTQQWPIRNIRRQDYQKKGGDSWTRSWQVHFTFKGRKPVSQLFNDNRYGGKEAALLIAQRFRDAMEVGRESLEPAANGN